MMLIFGSYDAKNDALKDAKTTKWMKARRLSLVTVSKFIDSGGKVVIAYW